jgi:chromosome segregation ATPase
MYFASNLGKDRNELRVVRDGLIQDKNKLTADLNTTRTDLNNTRATLAKTTEDLNTAVANFEAKKVEIAQKDQEIGTLKEQVVAKGTELDQAKTELASAQETLKKIQVAIGGESLENFEKVREALANQAEENKILGQQLVAMRSLNKTLEEKVAELSTTPINLRGKVAAVQSSWGFVVLDVGRDRRVQTNTHFLVYRDTKLISKVQVRTVGESTSVAEVVPEFNKSNPRVGDLVVH